MTTSREKILPNIVFRVIRVKTIPSQRRDVLSNEY